MARSVTIMPRITFIEFDGTEHHVDAASGLTLMETARDNDVPGIEAECGGAGACATCHVYVDERWLAASGGAAGVEREMLGLLDDARQESRLSCQINLSDAMHGLVVRLPQTQGF